MKLIMLFKRKTGLTSEQFREHYEKRHVPLALRLLPFFKTYTRNYVRHDLNYLGNDPRLAKGGVEFDVVTEVLFASNDDYERMKAALADPSVLNEIVDDENRFMDRAASVVIFVDEERTPMTHETTHRWD